MRESNVSQSACAFTGFSYLELRKIVACLHGVEKIPLTTSSPHQSWKCILDEHLQTDIDQASTMFPAYRYKQIEPTEPLPLVSSSKGNRPLKKKLGPHVNDFVGNHFTILFLPI